MNIEDCKVDQIVCFKFGYEIRKGIILGFGMNPVNEVVPIVKWEDSTGNFASAGLCHPKNIELFQEGSL